MLFLDGVYVVSQDAPAFRRVTAPSRDELDALIERISQRVGRYLERAGLVVRDVENSHLSLESAETTAIDDLRRHSVTYRIAVGPRMDRKVFTLQTLPTRVVLLSRRVSQQEINVRRTLSRCKSRGSRPGLPPKINRFGSTPKRGQKRG